MAAEVAEAVAGAAKGTAAVAALVVALASAMALELEVAVLEAWARGPGEVAAASGAEWKGSD